MRNVSIERVYSETLENIRATDEISFKLIGLAPLVSGVALLTFLLKGDVSTAFPTLVTFISIAAALVTLGLFRWELRNIQHCEWLRDRAQTLESYLGLSRMPDAPSNIGKAEAEKFVYFLTIAIWLFVPSVVTDVFSNPMLFRTYIAVAALIAIGAGMSVFQALPSNDNPSPWSPPEVGRVVEERAENE